MSNPIEQYAPEVAASLAAVRTARMGLDTSRESTLWRDRALVELNRAVLHSFEQAGAKISDHHTESQRFLTHISNEAKAQRPVPADWSWIVPPLSGGIRARVRRPECSASSRSISSRIGDDRLS